MYPFLSLLTEKEKQSWPFSALPPAPDVYTNEIASGSKGKKKKSEVVSYYAGIKREEHANLLSMRDAKTIEMHTNWTKRQVSHYIAVFKPYSLILVVRRSGVVRRSRKEPPKLRAPVVKPPIGTVVRT